MRSGVEHMAFGSRFQLAIRLAALHGMRAILLVPRAVLFARNLVAVKRSATARHSLLDASRGQRPLGYSSLISGVSSTSAQMGASTTVQAH
jgi:hypothetical protein